MSFGLGLPLFNFLSVDHFGLTSLTSRFNPLGELGGRLRPQNLAGGEGGEASGSGNKYSEDCTEQTEKSIITTILYFTCAVIDIMLTLQANVNKPKLSKNPLSLPLADPTNVGRTQHKS
jgi:hypothetical protein